MTPQGAGHNHQRKDLQEAVHTQAVKSIQETRIENCVQILVCWVVGLENVRTNRMNLQVERQTGLHCERQHKDDVALTYLENVAMPAKVQKGLNCLFFL